MVNIRRLINPQMKAHQRRFILKHLKDLLNDEFYLVVINDQRVNFMRRLTQAIS